MSDKGIESILARAMSDTAFADALFANPEEALAEYELPAEIIAKFKEMSHAEFNALDVEERQSMSVMHGIKRKASGKQQYLKVTMKEVFVNSSK